MTCHHGFVLDGRTRARAAVSPQIKAQVEMEFAARLRVAAWLQRAVIRLAMRREIRRRIELQAPAVGLY